jgi:acyl-CoA hydrolase
MTSSALPEARLLEMVFPDHTNHLGTLFGGQALAWMDKAAFIVATRHARRVVVTARSEEVSFRVPVRTGQLVELVSRVVATGRSSMQVEVEMTAEDPLTGDRRVCTTGRFVMIALDSNGSPTPVPPLPDTSGDAGPGEEAPTA